jgi:hypothetical protein
MAQQVVRTFDLYNTTVLLPGYTINGYENEFGLTRGFYSTDYSANPIGSKTDFFTQLDDPCSGIFNPNPVFTVPIGLSALNPLWFEQWWDEAIFYSHPLVLEQLEKSNPFTYQSFSDSVGTLYYTASGSPVNPVLSSKIPNSLLEQISRLNSYLNTDFKAFTPSGFGPNKTKFNAQYSNYFQSTNSVKNIVNSQYSSIKQKLPLNVVQTGNLVTPSNWNYKTSIQGVNTAVDRLGNVISAPNRALANATNRVKSLIPKIQLPSLSKLTNGIIPNMPAVTNVINSMKSATGALQSGVAAAQGTMAVAQGIIAAGKNTVGAVQNAITSTTGSVKALGSGVVAVAAPLTNITNSVTTGNITAAAKNQFSNTTVGLNNNATITINSSKDATTADGRPSVNVTNSFKFDKPSG